MKTTIARLIVTVVCLLLLSCQGQKASQTMPTAQLQETNAFIAGNTMQQGLVATQMFGAVTTQQATAFEPSTEAELNAQVRKILEARNHPVELWGKVVDQDDTPLSGVKVESEIGHFVWPPDQYPNGVSTKKETTTDTSGQFYVYDDSAEGVSVTLQKYGYEQESLKGNGYALGSGGGSPGSPIILTMWSTNSHQELITGRKSFHIVPDGRTYVIDIVKGTISADGVGDLTVWVKRPEQITYGKRYDWSCEMDVMNGGLLAASDSSMYLAPADGYTPSFQFKQNIGGGWGDSTGDKSFYVRLKDGQEYGKITIELMAYYNDQIPGMIRLSYALNPSGSRILR